MYRGGRVVRCKEPTGGTLVAATTRERERGVKVLNGAPRHTRRLLFLVERIFVSVYAWI